MWKFKRRNTGKAGQELQKSYDEWDISPDPSSWEKMAVALDRESVEEQANPALDVKEADLAAIQQDYSNWEPEFDEQKIWEDVNDSMAFEKVWENINESLDRDLEPKSLRPLFIACTICFVLISFFVNESKVFEQALPLLSSGVKSEETQEAESLPEGGKNTPGNLLSKENKTDYFRLKPDPLNMLYAPEILPLPDESVNEKNPLQTDDIAENIQHPGYLKVLPFDLSYLGDSILPGRSMPAKKLKSKLGFFVSTDLIGINYRDNINNFGAGISAGLSYNNLQRRIPYSLDLGFSVSSNRFSSYYNGEFTDGKLSMTSLYLGLNFFKTINPEVNLLAGINFNQVNNFIQERNNVLTQVNAAKPTLIGFKTGIEKKVTGNFRTRLSYTAAFPAQRSATLLTVHELSLSVLF